MANLSRTSEHKLRVAIAGLGPIGKGAAEAQLAYGMALVAVDLFYQYHSGMGIRNLLNNPGALAGIAADLEKRMRK